ncbi:hydrolase [Streptomyces griseoaurantiacus]|uniref:hydrolase n=1 Tax=Streptomyces TaxID=1883 RepID=UPI0029B865F4|nr:MULTISPECIES: hydrolase [unclassified Streptomyces]MDX3090027.1 hydrolase [Streptomyces sp. ME12-02E]MDX3333419.1 hydrolase [Streptomyces sp. ME02-6978a]MDX3362019.1 hydrolase [Streptomyces sp. ME02-6978.2a]
MSLWTSLEPASTTVDPGGSTTVRLRLRNTGDVVDEYRFEPVGSLAPWTVVEPATLRLYPGTTGTVDLRIAPPRTADAAAGPHPYGVRITPTEHPEAAAVPEGNVTVTPFTEVRAELVPPTVKGRLRGRPKLAVDNLGNTRLTASVNGSDNGDQLSYEVRPGNVQIEPGRAAFVQAVLKPRRIIWFGAKQDRPYTLSVQRSGVTPLKVEGTYVQRGFLPRWLATCLGLFLALAVTFVMLWIAYKPQVRTAATEKMQGAGVSTLPPSAPPSLKAPSSPEAPASVPAAPASGGAGGGGGGGGGAGSKKPKAPAATAATAVRKLAAQDPDGRHICYRAFVAGEGWTDAECDGETAGTPGEGTITAVNVAVAGAQGTDTRAYVHDPASTNGEGKYFDPWSVAADGGDTYAGSTKKGAPHMLGFAVNVDKGRGNVCQDTYVHDGDWIGLVCDQPGAGLDFTYAGTHDNNQWIQALRLTV